MKSKDLVMVGVNVKVTASFLIALGLIACSQ